MSLYMCPPLQGLSSCSLVTRGGFSGWGLSRKRKRKTPHQAWKHGTPDTRPFPAREKPGRMTILTFIGKRLHVHLQDERDWTKFGQHKNSNASHLCQKMDYFFPNDKRLLALNCPRFGSERTINILTVQSLVFNLEGSPITVSPWTLNPIVTPHLLLQAPITRKKELIALKHARTIPLFSISSPAQKDGTGEGTKVTSVNCFSASMNKFPFY